MLLLALLHRLSERKKLRLSVGHVDHALRVESASEAEIVRGFSESLGLVYEGERLDLPTGPALADRARRARQQVLQGQAQRQGARVIALAHTATDQAETLLLHGARGAGLRGMGGMRRWRPPWFRPLLPSSRATVRRLARMLELPFVDDPSNMDPKHPRVRIRRAVLPELGTLNPRVEMAFGELALQAQDAVEALEAWRDREFSHFESSDPARFVLEDFDQLPRAVASLILRKICERNGVDLSELSYRVLADIVAKAQDRAAAYAGRVSFPPGGFSPLRYHLRPRRILRLSRNELGIEIAPDPSDDATPL